MTTEAYNRQGTGGKIVTEAFRMDHLEESQSWLVSSFKDLTAEVQDLKARVEYLDSKLRDHAGIYIRQAAVEVERTFLHRKEVCQHWWSLYETLELSEPISITGVLKHLTRFAPNSAVAVRQLAEQAGFDDTVRAALKLVKDSVRAGVAPPNLEDVTEEELVDSLNKCLESLSSADREAMRSAGRIVLDKYCGTGAG